MIHRSLRERTLMDSIPSARLSSVKRLAETGRWRPGVGVLRGYFLQELRMAVKEGWTYRRLITVILNRVANIPESRRRVLVMASSSLEGAWHSAMLSL